MYIPCIDVILCNVFIQNFAKIHTENVQMFLFSCFPFPDSFNIINRTWFYDRNPSQLLLYHGSGGHWLSRGLERVGFHSKTFLRNFVNLPTQKNTYTYICMCMCVCVLMCVCVRVGITWATFGAGVGVDISKSERVSKNLFVLPTFCKALATARLPDTPQCQNYGNYKTITIRTEKL